jgi:hypothetical protein
MPTPANGMGYFRFGPGGLRIVAPGQVAASAAAEATSCPIIITQPEAYIDGGTAPQPVLFSVTLDVSPGAGISYQWQVDDGDGFVDITEGMSFGGGTITNVNTSEITIDGFSTSLPSSFWFRCIISFSGIYAGCTQLTSSSGELFGDG